MKLFLKDHRAILISDIIHVRRPDMQSIDAILHVNPRLNEYQVSSSILNEEKNIYFKTTLVQGLAMFFNPTDERLSQWIGLPLYYTGATDKVALALEGREQWFEELQRDFSIFVHIGEC